MATPSKKVTVTFVNQTNQQFTYNNVEYLPKALCLIFNGVNQNIELNQENIKYIMIEDVVYSSFEVDNSNGISKVKLKL